VLGVPSAGEYRMKASFQGTVFRGFYNREEVVRITNSSYASGRLALLWGNQNTSTTGAHCKSIEANDDFSRSFIEFVGDSMFRGDGATVNVGRANRIPNLVANKLITDDGADIDFANIAISGRRLDQILTAISQAPATVNSFPADMTAHNANIGRGSVGVYRPNAAKNLYVVLAGINDGGSNGSFAPASTIISRFEDVKETLEATGGVVYGVSPPHCDESKVGIGAGFNDKMDAINAWGNGADWSGGWIDLSSNAAVWSSLDAADRQSDGIHWTAQSMAVVANDFIYPAIRGEFVSSGRPGFIGGGYGGYILGA
jgi:hypothetical protein